MDPSKLPKYEAPPAIELVCGIQFEDLKKLIAPYTGLLWEQFKSEFQNAKQQVPLGSRIEVFDNVAQTVPLPTDFPWLPRIWFESADGTALIQLQRDRFIYNWKRVTPEDVYPHYENVIIKFRDYLSKFEKFLSEHSLGEIKPLQYELTYVNHIPIGQAWHNLGDIGVVFPDLSWRKTEERFLRELEGLSLQLSFQLPEKQGRLHASIRHGIRQPDQPILLFDLTCRGLRQDRSRSEMWTWFNLAHEWIVRGFADLTSSEVQKSIWRRFDG
jgi:uncharacterized protein (TIGR04255 family)